MYTSDASLISESDSGELTRGSSSGYLTSGPEDEYESGPSEGDGGAMAMASEPDDQLLPVDAAGICSGIPACNPAATLPTGWKRLKKASLLAAAGSQGLARARTKGARVSIVPAAMVQRGNVTV